MNLPNKPIQKATVICPLDPSVGIPNTSFDLEMYFELDNNQTEDSNRMILEFIRGKIQDLYFYIEGDKLIQVLFDFELEELQKQENETNFEET